MCLSLAPLEPEATRTAGRIPSELANAAIATIRDFLSLDTGFPLLKATLRTWMKVLPTQ
jgi:hypothetical protein